MSSNNLSISMGVSPSRRRQTSSEGHRPTLSRTSGQRPSCLVNASVTYCGDNKIYAFGGFDQYTDEVYNHVLKLDLETLSWTLVDNFGEIPGVRMGHTATLYQGHKLIIFGGENEHRTFLSDVVIFDINTAIWSQPAVSGPIPRGRSRHAAALYKDKLFVVGGLMGDSSVLDDICFLDLTTMTWSRAWSFVRKFDHAAWIWGEKLWVFGGLGQNMGRDGEVWWLDLRADPAFEGAPTGMEERRELGRPQAASRSYSQPRPTFASPTNLPANYPGHSPGVHANASFTIRPSHTPTAPGISSLSFVSNPDYPPQASGTHFYVYSSNALLDFVTPASTIRATDCGLAAFDLPTLRWQRLAEGAEIFNPGYRWHYCAINEDGSKAWLLGCATDLQSGFEEYLCDVLAIDLRSFGLLGDAPLGDLPDPSTKSIPAGTMRTQGETTLSGLGMDLAEMFDRSPELGGGADFVIIADPDDMTPTDDASTGSMPDATSTNESSTAPPIHVHLLIMQARWDHFRRLYNSGMRESQTKRWRIPEPYSVVRAFLFYLYTDSIARHPAYGIDLNSSDVAGLLVMANLYNVPALRLRCVHRLGRELEVEHAAVVWERARTAGEDWLRRRAASFCLKHWGRVVRTEAFRTLDRNALGELCEEIDTEGRVVGGSELEAVGGLVGVNHRLGLGQGAWGRASPGLRTASAGPALMSDTTEEGDLDDDGEMEMT
ncbi:MAG: ubiquitin-protein transferase activating protein [Watsoniomyces obsoletus]|nr:MAG: ubiquitin-protein transferase activating protein [Watsoniomyces obsoletus]